MLIHALFDLIVSVPYGLYFGIQKCCSYVSSTPVVVNAEEKCIEVIDNKKLIVANQQKRVNGYLQVMQWFTFYSALAWNSVCREWNPIFYEHYSIVPASCYCAVSSCCVPKRAKQSGLLVLGGLPSTESQVHELWLLGITMCISVVDEWELETVNLHASLAKFNMDHIIVRTQDYIDVPSKQQLDCTNAILKYQLLEKGTGVYVHCKSGRGRSAAVVIAFIRSQLQHKNIDESYKTLVKYRPQIHLSQFQRMKLTKIA